MRTIRFRGRKIDRKEWVYGELHISTTTRPHIHVDERRVLIDPNTVGQFTGLHDKNGKEIYEGDIIAANGKQIGYIVGGVRGYCYDVIYNPAKSNGEKSWALYSVVTIDYPNKCEVIGNIYDNPELLKED